MKSDSSKVDVHVLHLSSTDQSLWHECRDSLDAEPINLHLINGIPGHIGRARYAGFVKGTSEFISCIDPDDIVIPGAYAACLEVLDANPNACGAYTDELIIDDVGKVIKEGIWSQKPWNPLLQIEPKYLHHVFVMRRCFAEKCYLEMLRWPSMPEYILKCLITAYGPWVHVNRFGYKWRLSKYSAHSQISPTTVCAAQWRVIPVLQKAAKAYKALICPEIF
jgi:hypothetical protein